MGEGRQDYCRGGRCSREAFVVETVAVSGSGAFEIAVRERIPRFMSWGENHPSSSDYMTKLLRASSWRMFYYHLDAAPRSRHDPRWRLGVPPQYANREAEWWEQYGSMQQKHLVLWAAQIASDPNDHDTAAQNSELGRSLGVVIGDVALPGHAAVEYESRVVYRSPRFPLWAAATIAGTAQQPIWTDETQHVLPHFPLYTRG